MNPLQMPSFKITSLSIGLKWAKSIFLRILMSHSGIRNKTTILLSSSDKG